MDEKERNDLHDPNIKLMDHEYDGIQEFDQKLPNWWLFTLYGAIVFSIIFWIVRHQWQGDDYDYTKLEAQLAQVEEANLEATLAILNDDTLYGFAENPDWVAAGEKTYMQNCAACHKPDLTGLVGPSLIDEEWLHGSNPTDIFNTITDGVPDKGMQAWASQLGPKKIAEVVSFVLSQQP